MAPAREARQYGPDMKKESLRTTTTSASSLTASPTFLRLLTSLLAFVAIGTITPSTSAAHFDVQSLLALFDHSIDFVGDDLGQLLGPGDFNTVEHDDAARLIQRGRQLFGPYHLRNDGGHRAKGQRKGASEKGKRKSRIVGRIGKQEGP